ncbi:MAG: hypothetical protein ABJG78_13600 [Cyclobacteriaceae bacterium]
MNQQVKARLEEADEHFNLAKEELCKPEEDVVPYKICQKSYYSVTNYLSGFILKNGETVQESASIEDLIKRCREIDGRFHELHLAPLYHPTETEDVWMNLDAAHDFLAIAEKTRQMVIET